MSNYHLLAKLPLTTQCKKLLFADAASLVQRCQQINVQINVSAFHTGSKKPLGLLMYFFVYKVITNKVFKKVTCQLLCWWIPFPQWKHAAAKASNFLSCTPLKLQCRDCLVINRARTVPSLCMRLCSRESKRGRQEFPPIHQTTDLVFSIHCLVTVPPPLQLHLNGQRAVCFSVFIFPANIKKVSNVGLNWDLALLLFICWNLSNNRCTAQMKNGSGF